MSFILKEDIQWNILYQDTRRPTTFPPSFSQRQTTMMSKRISKMTQLEEHIVNRLIRDSKGADGRSANSVCGADSS